MYTYENHRPWRLAVLKSLPLILFFSLFSSAYGQVIPFINPSLEGPTGVSILPTPWYAMSGSPDTEIESLLNPYPIPASDGNNYVRLVWTWRDGAEEMACELGQQLDSGKTYTVSFDLAMQTFYSIPVFGALRIYGNKNEFEKGEVLWESGVFYHKTWKRYTVILKPLKNYKFLTFGPYNAGVVDRSSLAMTFIDNFSPVTETILFDVDVKNACPGQNNGTATVTIREPVGTYSYHWLPGGETSSSIKNMSAGTYTVNVTGATGVKTQQLVEITETYVKVATSIKDQHCNGVSDASLDVTASGGLEPYRYSLNADPVGQEDHIFRNISPGTYKVSVTDANGCAASQDVFVKELPALRLTDLSTKPASCNSATNGQIILTPAGGTPPFTYSLSPDRSQSDNIFRRLDAGIYHYRISDKNNCTLEGNAEVKREWRECAVFIPTAFSPNNDGKNELFRAKVQDDISEYRMAVYGRWGQLIFESNNPDHGWDGKLQGTDLPAGSYTWVITYKDRKQQHMQQQGSVLLVR